MIYLIGLEMFSFVITVTLGKHTKLCGSGPYPTALDLGSVMEKENDGGKNPVQSCQQV